MTGEVDRLNLLLSLRRYAEGEKAAREAITADPEWGAVYTFLALFLMNQGLNDKAIAPARTGVRKDAHAPWAHAVLGSVLGYLGQYYDGAEAIREALRLDPTYAYAYRKLAEILCHANRFRDAERAVLDGLRHHPDDEVLTGLCGWTEYKLGDFDAAIETAERGLRAHPNSSRLRNVLGCALWDRALERSWFARVRDHIYADAAFREALRIKPGEPTYRDNRRDNAVACQRYVLWLLLPLITVASAVLLVSGVVVGVAGGAFFVAYLLLPALVAYFPGFMLLKDGEEWFLLSAPFGWLGLPTIPPSMDDHRRGRFTWRFILAALVGLPLVVWGAALAVRF